MVQILLLLYHLLLCFVVSCNYTFGVVSARSARPSGLVVETGDVCCSWCGAHRQAQESYPLAAGAGYVVLFRTRSVP